MNKKIVKKLFFALFFLFSFNVFIFDVNADDDFILTTAFEGDESDFADLMLSNEFDYYYKNLTDSEFEIFASKNVDETIFDGLSSDEIQEIGLDEIIQYNSFILNYHMVYDIEESCMLMYSSICSNETEVIITNNLACYIRQNTESKLDALIIFETNDSRDYDYVWASDVYNEFTSEENEENDNVRIGWSRIPAIDKFVAGMISRTHNTISNLSSNLVVRHANVLLKIIVKGVVTSCQVVLTPIGAAHLGARLLNMKYMYNTLHLLYADFDCWQQNFGYSDVYDAVFNAGTRMIPKKLEFYDIDGDGEGDYKIWAWKGDYLNLGAGCELGLYKRSKNCYYYWEVDKNLAMTMSLTLHHAGVLVIPYWTGYNNKNWWITGFNVNYSTLPFAVSALSADFSYTFDAICDNCDCLSNNGNDRNYSNCSCFNEDNSFCYNQFINEYRIKSEDFSWFQYNGNKTGSLNF